jgi:hypothetical protein
MKLGFGEGGIPDARECDVVLASSGFGLFEIGEPSRGGSASLADFSAIGGEADAQGAKSSISALADRRSRFIKLTAQRITLTLEGALSQNF